MLTPADSFSHEEFYEVGIPDIDRGKIVCFAPHSVHHQIMKMTKNGQRLTKPK